MTEQIYKVGTQLWSHIVVLLRKFLREFELRGFLFFIVSHHVFQPFLKCVSGLCSKPRWFMLTEKRAYDCCNGGRLIDFAKRHIEKRPFWMKTRTSDIWEDTSKKKRNEEKKAAKKSLVGKDQHHLSSPPLSWHDNASKFDKNYKVPLLELRCHFAEKADTFN